MAIQVSEALQRRIGPLPAWGWGVAVGGGLLAFRILRGGSFLGTRDSGQPAENDIDEISKTPNPQQPPTPGPQGPAGPPGKDAPKGAPRPPCVAPGITYVWRGDTQSWQSMTVAKPSDTGTHTYFWDIPNCQWTAHARMLTPTPKASTVIADPGARGPSMLASSLGGGPTIDDSSIFDTPHIAPVDVTPQSTPSLVRSISLPKTPTIAGLTSDNMPGQRSPFGRPYHYGN